MNNKLRIYTFRFNNYVDDNAVNEFCKNHDVVEICPPMAVPMEIYSDGRQCGTLIQVTVIYKEV